MGYGQSQMTVQQDVASETGPRVARETVRLLETEPDLADAVPAAQRDSAVERSSVTVIERPADPAGCALPRLRPGAYGFLILDGFLMCRLTLGRRRSGELLGPSDLIRPTPRTFSDDGEPRPGGVALSDLRLAVLDERFATRMASWPELAAGLMARLTLRVHQLHLVAAMCAAPSIEDRLHLLLWHYARRWGRVTGDGIQLTLPLTHTELAAVVGARRPSVTTALTRLRDAGKLSNLERATWLLHDGPPAQLTALYEQAGLASARRPADEGRV